MPKMVSYGRKRDRPGAWLWATGGRRGLPTRPPASPCAISSRAFGRWRPAPGYPREEGSCWVSVGVKGVGGHQVMLREPEMSWRDFQESQDGLGCRPACTKPENDQVITDGPMLSNLSSPIHLKPRQNENFIPVRRMQQTRIPVITRFRLIGFAKAFTRKGCENGRGRQLKELDVRKQWRTP